MFYLLLNSVILPESVTNVYLCLLSDFCHIVNFIKYHTFWSRIFLRTLILYDLGDVIMSLKSAKQNYSNSDNSQIKKKIFRLALSIDQRNAFISFVSNNEQTVCKQVLYKLIIKMRSKTVFTSEHRVYFSTNAYGD